MKTLGKGWLADCGKYPSEKNCKLVMWAPDDQKQDLLDAGMAHAVKSHGHQDTPELRKELEGGLEHIDE